MSGAQESTPSLAGRPPPSDHVLGDARLRDLKPELEQFAVNARRAPTLDAITFALLFAFERQRRGSAFRKKQSAFAKINDQHLVRSDNQVASEHKSRFGDFGPVILQE
jgi:hypothetical protein